MGKMAAGSKRGEVSGILRGLCGDLRGDLRVSRGPRGILGAILGAILGIFEVPHGFGVNLRDSRGGSLRSFVKDLSNLERFGGGPVGFWGGFGGFRGIPGGIWGF